MNIDWKVVSQSAGYKSLKAAYESDVQEAHKETQRGRRPMRDKKEFRKLFDWVISRAIHYAYHKQTTVDVILNEWESHRNYWRLNYYQECRQPWLVKSEHVKWKSLSTRKKEEIKRTKNAYDRESHIKHIKKHYFNILLREQKEQSKRQGKKARWDKHTRDYKTYLKTKSIR